MLNARLNRHASTPLAKAFGRMPAALPPRADPSIPQGVRAWLAGAAKLLNVAAPSADRFAACGEIDIDGLSLALHPWGPAQDDPQWVAICVLPRPPGLSDAAWHLTLMHFNGVSLALGAFCFGLDSLGNGLAVSRIPIARTLDPRHLAHDLFQMSGTAAMAIEAASAIQAHASAPPATREPASPVPPLPTPTPAFEAVVAQALATAWHRPLLEEALTALTGRSVSLPDLKAVCRMTIEGISIELMAADDGQSLLLCSAISRPLADAAQQRAVLLANVELMLLTGCGIGLGPDGATLQSRWNAAGLDGADLKAHLQGFAHLARCMA